MFEIFIFGEIVPANINGWDGYVNSKDVIDQLAKANGQDICVRINSVGGDVYEGFAIYAELRRYAKKHGATITTRAEGMCASIATIFFLAGDTRVVNSHTEPFIHNAWCYAVGDADTIQKTVDDLKNWTSKIAKHYADHTDLTEEQALALMAAETFIGAEDCVKYRFAHEIENVAAPLNSVNFKTVNKMSTKNQPKSFKAKVLGALGLLNKILFDAENREVDFYDLTNDQEVAVGDMAKIGGKPAAEASPTNDGKIVMQSGDTYVFEGEELKEIIKKDPEEDDEPLTEEEQAALVAALENFQKENKNLKAELATAKQTVADYEALKTKLAKFENKRTNGKGEEVESKFSEALKNMTGKGAK